MSYVVAAAILHKLDQLDLRRAAVVPLCGCDGLFKYEIQVKTGWSRGAGEFLYGPLVAMFRNKIHKSKRQRFGKYRTIVVKHSKKYKSIKQRSWKVMEDA